MRPAYFIFCYDALVETHSKTRDDFSCGGIVLDATKNKILLVKVENLSKAAVWTFPKGHPKKNESDTDAALREVKEETGWECRVVKHLIDIDYFYVHDKIRTHKTVRWFLMEPVKKTGNFNPGEILDCEWADGPEARKRISYESDKKLLTTMGF